MYVCIMDVIITEFNEKYFTFKFCVKKLVVLENKFNEKHFASQKTWENLANGPRLHCFNSKNSLAKERWPIFRLC